MASERTVVDICVAFKAHQGWVNAAAVQCRAGNPAPVLAERLDLVRADDREACEPYHVAGGWAGLERVPRPAHPALVVRRGRRRQAAAARRCLQAFQRNLQSRGWRWCRAVVLTARGRPGDLEQILRAHALVHVAEGEAIRDATRGALRRLGIDVLDQDEKSVLAEAARRLPGEDVDTLMNALRPATARAWTREERLIALAAWLHAQPRPGAVARVPARSGRMPGQSGDQR